MVLRKSFYIRWSAGRSPRVHEVNPGRDPSQSLGIPVSGAIPSLMLNPGPSPETSVKQKSSASSPN